MNARSPIFRALAYYGTHFNHRGKWIVHNHLRKLLNANITQDIEVVRNGLKWLLNPSDYVHQDVFWHGAKDYWDLHHIIKYLKSGDTIFDVGANFGYYSVFLADTLAKRCSIHAFEPSPDTFARLQHNIRMNRMGDCVNAYQRGISERSKQLQLRTRVSGNSGSATVVDAGSDGENQGMIELVSLDEFVERQRIDRIALLKIDVEGHELHVLKGGRKAIIKNRPVILIEIDPPLLNRAGCTVEDIVSLIRSYGYGMHVAKRDKLLPYSYNSADKTYVNVICINDAQ